LGLNLQRRREQRPSRSFVPKVLPPSAADDHNERHHRPKASGKLLARDGKELNSDVHRLYKWVESLHGMYRSHKHGRQSGSSTDDRVVLLIKQGFVFRND
jgi:hypothetical protein